MPFFYFDLVIDGHPYDQGGMILENRAVASDRADALAQELHIVRPELRDRQCFVRVMSEDNQELHRVPLDPIETWSVKTTQK